MASTTLEIIIAARDQFSGTANKVIGSLDRMDSSAKRVGRGFTQLGAGLVRASAVGVAAIAGLGAVVIREGVAFEDAFAGVRKTVDEAELAAAGLTFDDLADSFREMATRIPIAAAEFARIGETAGALGIAAGDIDQFTETVALLGVTTDLTTEAAAEGFGKLGAILGLTGDDFRELADSVVALGNDGASTESEIIELSKRFAASGRQAGLLKEEIVALASAASSLGIEPEAGGSALSRLFSNMASDIALATDEGKAFAEVVGESLSSLEDQIRDGQALPVFMDFLQELKSMDRVEAAKALQAVGITNVRDRDAVLKMAQNLTLVNDALETSRTATGALGVEAAKRFDTIASKLTVLKQNLVEGALIIGEGMLPAIGRATEKLIAFLQVPENKTALKELGEDVGDFIDGVDWDGLLRDGRSFVGLLKDAGSAAASILSILSKLPNEVKAAGLGLIGLNKLSGGLVGAGLGNIAGGIGETVIRGAGSKLPKVGALFAQPVFVTNWPAGGLMGGKGGKGGGGILAGGGAIVGALGLLQLLGLGVAPTADKTKNHGMVPKDGAWTKPDVQSVTSSTRETKSTLTAGFADQRAGERAITGAVDQVATQQAIAAGQAIVAEVNRSMQAIATITGLMSATAAVDRTQAAVNSARTGIVAAIRANRPIVNVDVSSTNVVRTTVVQERAGRQSGSRAQGRIAS